MATIQIPDNVILQGNLNVTGTITVPAGSFPGTQLSTVTTAPTNTLRHQHSASFAQGSAATATAATQVVHIVRGLTGTIKEVAAGMIAANAGAATVTVDVKKNGTTVLTSPVSLTSATASGLVVLGAITTTTLAQGDRLEVVITAAAGGGTLGTGLFARVTVDEDPVL